MNLTPQVWLHKNAEESGAFVTCPARNISPVMSFLEMLDVVNEDLIRTGARSNRLRPRLP